MYVSVPFTLRKVSLQTLIARVLHIFAALGLAKSDKLFTTIQLLSCKLLSAVKRLSVATRCTVVCYSLGHLLLPCEQSTLSETLMMMMMMMTSLTDAVAFWDTFPADCVRGGWGRGDRTKFRYPVLRLFLNTAELLGNPRSFVLINMLYAARSFCHA